MKPGEVELHIQELILDGFAPGNRHCIEAVVEAELARLFAEGDVPPSLTNGGEMDHLDGGAFEIAPDATAGVIGAQVAQALYEGLNR